MFTEIERTIVDWCEANSIPVEAREGEWFMMSEDGDSPFSLTALANAIVGKLPAVMS